MENNTNYTANAGGVQVLWVIASSAWPVTVKEIAERLGVPPNHATQTVLSLHEDGYLKRQERPTDSRGRDPYEYTITTPRDTIDLPV